MPNYDNKRKEMKGRNYYSYIEIEKLQNAPNTIILRHIKEFCANLLKNGPYELPLSYYDKAVPVLISLMRRSVLIARACVNVLFILLRTSEIYEVYYKNSKTIQDLIINYENINDTFVKEYSTIILIKVHEHHPEPKVYLMLELVSGVFNTLEKEADPDVICNSLKLFLCMLNTYGALVFLCDCCLRIKIDVMFPLHFNPHGKIRETTFRIFHHMTFKKALEVKDMWKSFRLMLRYFALFYEPGCKWDESQNFVVEVINNCLHEKLLHNSDLFDDQIRVFIMSVPVDYTPLSFARLTIINQIMRNHIGVKVLHSYNIITILIQYLKLDCNICNILACEAISEYIHGEKSHELFLTDTVICHIGQIVDRVYVEWNPYKDSIIHILYRFIATADSSQIMWLQKAGFIPLLKEIIINPDIVSKRQFDGILQMYRSLFKVKRYQITIIQNRDVLITLRKYIQDENTRIKRKAFKLLRSCLGLKCCRIWFKEIGGIETLKEMFETGDIKTRKYVKSMFKQIYPQSTTETVFTARGYLSDSPRLYD